MDLLDDLVDYSPRKRLQVAFEPETPKQPTAKQLSVPAATSTAVPRDKRSKPRNTELDKRIREAERREFPIVFRLLAKDPVPPFEQIEELCRALKGNTVTKVILVHGWDLTDEAFKLIVELIETLPNCLGLNAGENDETMDPSALKSFADFLDRNPDRLVSLYALNSSKWAEDPETFARLNIMLFHRRRGAPEMDIKFISKHAQADLNFWKEPKLNPLLAEKLKNLIEREKFAADARINQRQTIYQGQSINQLPWTLENLTDLPVGLEPARQQFEEINCLFRESVSTLKAEYIALKEYLGYQGLLDKLTSGMEEIEAGFSWFFDFIKPAEMPLARKLGCNVYNEAKKDFDQVFCNFKKHLHELERFGFDVRTWRILDTYFSSVENTLIESMQRYFSCRQQFRSHQIDEALHELKGLLSCVQSVQRGLDEHPGLKERISAIVDPRISKKRLRDLLATPLEQESD